MDHIQGSDRNQFTLFPEALDETISQENTVRFIDADVDSLDLKRLGFHHVSSMKPVVRPTTRGICSSSTSMATSIDYAQADNSTGKPTAMRK